MNVTEIVIREGTNWPGWLTVGIVLASACVALWSLLDARRTRHAQLVGQLHARWDAKDVLDSALLGRRYLPTKMVQLIDEIYGPDVDVPNPEDLTTWYEVSVYPNLIETFGVLVHQDMLSSDVVYELWSAAIVEAWDQWEPAIRRLREISLDEDGLPMNELWEHFERLADEMRTRRSTDRASQLRGAQPSIDRASLTRWERIKLDWGPGY